VKIVNSWAITGPVIHYWYEIKLVIEFKFKFDISNIYVNFLLTEEVVLGCGYLERIKFYL